MQPKITLIGGGTGSFTLLQEFKNWTTNITAIVNMSDDGGSSGVLRDELGVLPPGDIRQCLVALSDYPDARDLFNYRFNKGKLKNHPVGNIILSALELYYNDFAKAIDVVSQLLRLKGEVLPVSTQKHQICLIDQKRIIKGETNILKHQIKSINPLFYLEPQKVKINPKARRAILNAELVIIAPGNFFGSLIPPLLVDGMKQALAQTKAKVVMISNLINKPKQTFNWTVLDYWKQINKYLYQETIDFVLYNNHPIKQELLDKYAQDQEFPVGYQENDFRNLKTQFIGSNLVNLNPYQQNQVDQKIKRTLIRHDAKALKRELKLILNKI